MKSDTPYLIFDFDGTLADTFEYLVGINNTLAQEFHFKTITKKDAKNLKNYPVLEIIKKLGVPVTKLPQIVKRAQEELQKNILDVKPFDGLSAILNQLDELGFKMGIITTNSTENVEQFLKNHNIHTFDFTVTCSKIWGKNKALKKLLKNHSLTLDQALYIGDETRDIEAAQKVGIKVAAVSWGYNTKEALAKYKPDYLLHSPKELIKLFSAA